MRRLDRLVEAVCAAIILGVVLVVFGSVISRYVLVRPVGWTEEVARLGLVWVTFLGAYLAFRRGAHVGIDVLVAKLSARARQRLGLVVNLVMALGIAVLVRQGVSYAGTFFADPSPYLRFPIGIQYLALPVGGLLWLVALAARSRATLATGPGRDPAPPAATGE